MEQPDSSNHPFAFISYRRHDSSAAARWLFQSIRQSFGLSSAFMDTEEIRSGDDWPTRIESALAKATVVIVVIGPHWLRLADEYGRRRIDRTDDWVYREVLYALVNGVTLLPVIILNTPIPSAEGLPKKIERLSLTQAFHLREEAWQQDLASLMARLQDLGFRRTSETKIRYPTPHIRIRDLSEEELKAAMTSLPGWGVVISDLPGQVLMKRSELHKIFEFSSFEEAIRFISTSSKYITETDHHPRWENLWRTISIWLSTWDIGHKISSLDLELAQHFESFYSDFLLRRE